MEKLIELLLEYKPQIHYLDKPKGVYDKRYGIGWCKREGDIGGWFSEEIIISNKFWFIKWLVEKDKIDRDKVLISFTMSESDGLGNYYGHGVEDYQRMLMLLSIQDEPIEFLISILK